SRNVVVPGLVDALTAKYDAGTAQVFGEAGYRLETRMAAFEPFASLAYVNLHTDSFTEKGRAAALTSAASTTETTFTTLGLRASAGFDLGGMQATAQGTLGWRHAFGDTTPTADMAFAGGDLFTIAGVPIARDTAIVGAGLDFRIADSTTLGISYSGQFGKKAADQGVRATMQVRF
ncbi:autotransporter domain-containing protein, partial [Mesorhizobium sp. M7A.F.Ca.CA.003.01.2.1]|uniref:autotransporter outer membrane beta-barrel domain-containing protein n=1 Tax=Mesorhizobium sp. M7A.F.Ca.CA.003.01.2.1 TaxID=2496722 RepID=UPI000FCA90E0